VSGETADAVSGWTVDTLGVHFAELRRTDHDSLKSYFSQRDERDKERDRRLDERALSQEVGVTTALAAAKEAVTAAMAAAEKATSKAEASQQKAADAAQAAADRENEELRRQIDLLRGTRREGVAESREGGRATISTATAILGAVFAAILLSLALFAAFRAPHVTLTPTQAPAVTVTVPSTP